MPWRFEPSPLYAEPNIGENRPYGDPPDIELRVAQVPLTSEALYHEALARLPGDKDQLANATRAAALWAGSEWEADQRRAEVFAAQRDACAQVLAERQAQITAYEERQQQAEADAQRVAAADTDARTAAAAAEVATMLRDQPKFRRMVRELLSGDDAGKDG